MDERGLGRLLVVLGLVAVVIGVLVWTGALSWFGRLPGDIRIEGERTRVFIPITSMLLVSVVVSLLLSLLRR
jgi:NAD/NADP transhydrogenase beta subunit